MKKASLSDKLYVGVDVGGTKIQASLISASGIVLANHRRITPRDCSPEVTMNVIEESIREVLEKENKPAEQLQGLGIAVPGVVHPDTGHVVVTPNMNLSGVDLGQNMQQRFQVPVAVGNDCNLGTLGECWLGSGRNTNSCVGIFVGTGIGAGIVMQRQIVSGAGNAAGEIGHIVTQLPCEDWRNVLHLDPSSSKKDKKRRPCPTLTLPRCGCGNYGCFETFASRTAIERFIREAVEGGAKSIIQELNGGNLEVIRSGAIAKALKAGDEVVSAIVHYAAQVIGFACLSVRHFLDPEVIILGGGLIEACHKYMMPVIDAIVLNDQLPSASGNRRILISSLGDDAVVLGAVALVRSIGTTDPLKRIRRVIPKYPLLHLMAEDVIMITDQAYTKDFMILSDGTIRSERKVPKKNPNGFRLKDLQEMAQGGVDLIIMSTASAGEVALSGKCHDYLFRRGIDFRILPPDEAVQLYNSVGVRRSVLFHFE